MGKEFRNSQLLVGLCKLIFLGFVLVYSSFGFAEDGVGEAYYRQGVTHLSGSKSAQNPQAAVQAWGRAEAQDHPVATYNLAQMYLVGEGVTQDTQYARVLFAKAARLGVSEASQALAGIEVPVKVFSKTTQPATNRSAGAVIFAATENASLGCKKLLLDENEIAQWGQEHSEKPFLLQLFASAKCERAVQYVGKLDGLEDAKIFLKSVGGEDIYAVMVGSFRDRDEAQDYAEEKNLGQAWAQSVFSLTKKSR